jgi:exonuclease III
MNSSNVLIWNVRGVNDRGHRDTVRKVVVSCKPILICLQETKLALIDFHVMLSIFGRDYRDFVYLPAQGTRGGILVTWRDGVFGVVDQWWVHQHSVFVKLSVEDEPAWWFTGVYGPSQDAGKVAFLDELREVRSECSGPWVLAGDFNMIYSSEDKNNTNLNRAMMGRFRWLVNDLELREMPLIGWRYTWSNERDSPTLVKLDRVLCTSDWEDIFPDCILQSQASEVSDHCPLLLGLRDGVRCAREAEISFREFLD